MWEILPTKVKEQIGLQLLVRVSKVPDRDEFPEKDISQFDFGSASIRGAIVPSVNKQTYKQVKQTSLTFRLRHKIVLVTDR